MRKNSSNKTSGLWPTPDANAVNSGENPETWLARREKLKAKGINGNGAGMPLGIAAKLWPTPQAHDVRKRGNTMADHHHYAHDLANAVLESTPTSEPSTEPPTEAQPYLPEGFLASHFPKPGSEEARKMTATSGRRCSELYMKPGPLGCLVRTLLESSRWNSTECFLTWKVKATPSNRLLFQLAPSMPNTDETEFGLWATPNVPNGGRAMNAEDVLSKGQTERGKRQVDLASQVKMWPTPRTEGFDAGRHRGQPDSLHSAVKMWPTVTANDAKNNGGPSQLTKGQGGRNLNVAVSGSLNPTWVEWLMGYPLGWTALKDSAMRLFRKSRSRSSGK